MSTSAPPVLRQAIVVVGPPGSGAGTVVRAVELLGAATVPGEDGVPSPVARFNAKTLADARRGWWDPKPVAAEWLDPRRLAALCARAAGLLSDAFRDQSLLVLGDRCLPRLLPVWIEAFRRVQVAPLFLLVARNPIDAAAALLERHAVDAEHAQQLWLSHLLPAEEATRAHPRAVVHYDRLLADWRETLLDAYGRIGCDAVAVSGEGAVAVDALLAALPPGPPAATTDRLLQDPAVSSLVKDLYCDLRQTAAHRGLDRERWHRGCDQFQRAWQLISPGDGPSHFPQPAAAASRRETPKADAPAPAPPERSAAAQRTPALTRPGATTATEARPVILHYHLFKNAGTSLDHALKAQFGDAWRVREGSGPGWRAAEIAEFLEQNPDVVVLSSHTALLPVPVVPGAAIYPLLFLRHPLDRIRSIYDFESRQVADTEGARVARSTDLNGYVRWRVARRGDRAIRDFQTYRLAMAVPPTEGDELTRARRALQTLPFVGLVERYEASLAIFEEGLRPAFPGLRLSPTRANVTQRAGQSLEDRLAALRKELGDELFGQLEEANRADLELHRQALAGHDAVAARTAA